jgi:multidrug efflux pump subunit AcrA (membrane-fusion protein)
MSTSTAELNRARERVLALARQIEDLSHPDTDENTYFPEFLKRLLSAVGAPAGVVWLKSANGSVNPRSEQGLALTGYRDNPQADQVNAGLLTDVFQTGQSSMYGGGERADKPTPTNHLYVLSPILKGRECIGVVEVFQRPDTDPRARPGYLQFIEQMCGYASRYVKLREEGTQEAPPADFWREFNRFSVDLQRSLHVKEVAATAANDGRQLIRADRISVAVFHGTQLRMQAVSGQETVNRKANAIRLLEKLASKVVPTHEPLMYVGKVDNLPPQIEQPLADYIQESGARCVIVIPLFASEALITRDPDKKTGKKPEVKRKVIGAYIVEQITESRPKPGMLDRLNLVSEHVATSLSNALTHQNLFLLPVWRALGTAVDSLRGRTLYKFLAAVVALIAVTVALLVAQWDYRVEGKGRLMPVVKHEVFAGEEGQVMQVTVRGGEVVKKGDLLVLLRNEELSGKMKQVESEIEEYQQSRKTLQLQRNRLNQDNTEQDSQVQLAKINGEIASAKIKEETSRLRKELLDQQIKNLKILAPSDGVVATFHVDQLLENRPVQRGEILLEVMDTTKEWRLELDVPDYRLGHIRKAQDKFHKEDLDVEFVLATATETKHQGLLESISTRAVPSEQEGSVVEMYVSLDDKTKDEIGALLHIGADVRAKINCGKQMLGYVLFGDVVEFVQNRLWF